MGAPVFSHTRANLVSCRLHFVLWTTVCRWQFSLAFLPLRFVAADSSAGPII